MISVKSSHVPFTIVQRNLFPSGFNPFTVTVISAELAGFKCEPVNSVQYPVPYFGFGSSAVNVIEPSHVSVFTGATITAVLAALLFTFTLALFVHPFLLTVHVKIFVPFPKAVTVVNGLVLFVIVALPPTNCQ